MQNMEQIKTPKQMAQLVARIRGGSEHCAHIRGGEMRGSYYGLLPGSGEDQS